jgi:hypothetical protein
VALGPFRSFRDSWAESLLLWFDSTDPEHVEWFEQIALQRESAVSSLSKAFAWASDQRRWNVCGEIEEFSKFCKRVARLESAAVQERMMAA